MPLCDSLIQALRTMALANCLLWDREALPVGEKLCAAFFSNCFTNQETLQKKSKQLKDVDTERTTNEEVSSIYSDSHLKVEIVEPCPLLQSFGLQFESLHHMRNHESRQQHDLKHQHAP